MIVTKNSQGTLNSHAQDEHEDVLRRPPHSPWQRPTNEDTNGLLRQYFPKITGFSRWSAEDLKAVVLALNNHLARASIGRPPAGTFKEQPRSI